MDFLGRGRAVLGLRAPCRLRSSRGRLPAVALVVLALGASGSVAQAASRQARPAHGKASVSVAALMRRVHKESRVSLKKSSTTPYWACPESLCDAIVDPRPVKSAAGRSIHFAMPDGGPTFEGGGEEGGIDPQELRAAYDIPATGGEGQTVALIEEAGYKDAEKDLKVYRARYGLSPCTKKNGCFRQINPQGGKARNRLVDVGWETETALDLDMVSAACPGCHILLVDEAASLKELGEAVDTAVAQGATEVSNSYGLPEQGCEKVCEATFADYDHAGVPIMVSAGDHGYDNNQSQDSSPNYPATLPSVVAVGGTSLKKAANARGWSEEVWGEAERGIGTGSGCASPSVGGKPYWQTDSGCAERSDNDVAAVGACVTPVSTYASVEGGWRLVCGTSASSPLVAGIEAHANAFSRSLPGADAFYHDPAALYDVTSGSNGVCTSPPGYQDLCNAGVGWDGPTGNGTPHGALELTGLAPNARTDAASAVSAGSATLNGKVEPSGLPTSYHFEYGTSSAYGSSVPLPEGSAGSGTSALAVSATVGELQANTVYHYRIVATNSAGTAYGGDQEFNTAAPVVTEVSPNSGGLAGYSPVQITGANFVNVTSVSFGSTSAAFTVNSSTSITATIPLAEKEGAVNITVTTPAGQSAATPADEFSYTLGDMLAWGQDGGDLGRGFDGSFSDVPIEVLFDETPVVKQLAANSAGSAALLGDGEVMTWGEGSGGNLGDGHVGLQDTPVKVCAVGVSECPGGPYLQGVAQLASGYAYDLALLDNGTVVGWGRNKMGQLGGGTPAAFVSSTPVPVCAVVEEPCSPGNLLKEVTQIAAGRETSYALLQNGTVEAWGANGLEGALGDGKAAYEESSRSPVAVTGLSAVSAIAANGYGGLALLQNGTVEAWGSNEAGTLGDASKAETSDVPVLVCSGTGKKDCGGELSEVSAVYGSDNTSYALLKNGSVAAWGSNIKNSLGDPGDAAPGPETCKVGIEREKEPCSRTPIDVDISEVSELATGQGSADVLALLSDGELMAWGSGVDGDLGGGRSEFFGVATPEHICAPYSTGPCSAGPYLGGEVLAMAVGGSHDLVYDRH